MKEILLVIVLSLFVFMGCNNGYTPIVDNLSCRLKVGQIWVSKSDNPFNERSTYRKVVEINGNYVRYSFGHSIENVNRYESSCRCSTFRYGDTLYQDVEGGE